MLLLPHRALVTSRLPAQLGISHVAVTRRPVVGVLSTGDEVADPGEEVAGAARIFDSNRPMLLQAARLCGATTRDLGVHTAPPFRPGGAERASLPSGSQASCATRKESWGQRWSGPHTSVT